MGRIRSIPPERAGEPPAYFVHCVLPLVYPRVQGNRLMDLMKLLEEGSVSACAEKPFRYG